MMFTTRFLSWRALLLISAASPVAVSPAFSQTTTNEEGETVYELSPFQVDASEDEGYRATNTISGTRLNTAIKDIPMPIEVITDAFIEDTGSTDLRDALSYSSGIILQSQNDAGNGNSTNTVGGVHNPEGTTSNKSQTSYKVRGFITDATLRDGYRRQFASDSANIGRVEVIRGPAALLYGIGNFGGIVNYMPMMPPSQDEQEFTVTVGNRGHRRTTYTMGGPLGDPLGIQYRVTAAYEENKSHTELRSDDHFFISPIVTFRPTEMTEVTLDFEYTNAHDNAVGFQSIRARADVPADQQDRLERAGFITFPDKDVRTMRWSGPDTYVDTKSTNTRFQITHQFAENLNVLVGYNDSKVEFDVRDIGGSIQQNAGPENLQATITVIPADVVNGDSEFVAGEVENAIFQGEWTDKQEEIDREQVRVELNYAFEAFPDSELFAFNNSFLLGRSEEYSREYIFERKTMENEYVWQDPSDSSYIRFGLNGDGTAAPPMEDFALNDNSAWNQGTYLVYQGEFLQDRATFVGGVRRDRNDISTITTDFRADEINESRPGAQEKDTTQLGLSFKVTDQLSVYALKSDGLQPNFDGFRDVNGNAMEAVLAESEEVGIKFDLLEGKLSGTISAYRIEQTGTPIFYWWSPSPVKTNWDRDADIVYNVNDFNPGTGNQFTVGAQNEWDAAVAAGAAYQIDGAWYINATQATGGAYLDAVFDGVKSVGGWPGWLYAQDENTNNASEDWSADSASGFNTYLSGDQESSGWEAQFNYAPTENLQFVVNYAQTKRQVVNAGAFPDMYGDGPVDRHAIWFFPDGQWGLTGRFAEFGTEGAQFLDEADTSTWQGLGYGAGEAQDDTPLHAASFWGNYNVLEGPLAGLAFGLGASYESEREYFSGITDGSGQLVVDGEGQRVVLETDKRYNVDAMIRYPFKIDDRDAHVQLNVYNMLDDTDPYGYIYATGRAWTLQFGMRM